MQQLCHAAFAVGNPPRLFDIMCNFFGGEVKTPSKMLILRFPLLLRKCGVTAARVVSLQSSQTAFEVTLKVIASDCGQFHDQSTVLLQSS